MAPYFEWRDSISLAPMFGLLGLCLPIIAILKLKGKLSSKTLLFFIILLVPIVGLFLAVKIHGEEIKIEGDRISGHYPFHSFDVRATEISAIRSSQRLRGGNTASLYLKDGRSPQIPMVYGTRGMEYKAALERFCRLNNVLLDWAPEKSLSR